MPTLTLTHARTDGQIIRDMRHTARELHVQARILDAITMLHDHDIKTAADVLADVLTDLGITPENTRIYVQNARNERDV